MNRVFFVLLSFALGTVGGAVAENPESVIETFESAGARLSRNSDGEVIKVFSGGRPLHSVEELQSLGKVKSIEELALNDPQAANSEWGFLHEMPHLRKLTIWHCKTIDSLAPFSGLSIESLTVGGSMGLRDLNRETPVKHRDAVLTLTDLPNLQYLHLYHTPVVCADEHLSHIVEQFPRLEELKIDVHAPQGIETTITPEGLAVLKQLELKVLSLENIHTFTLAHMEVVASLESLEAFLLDGRKNPFDTSAFEKLLREARPDVEIVVAGAESKGPPRRK